METGWVYLIIGTIVLIVFMPKTDILKKMAGWECVMSGYNFCWENSGSYDEGCASATVNAKTGMNEVKIASVMKSGYIIKSAKVSYRCIGTKAYVTIGGTVFPSCSVNGCNAPQVDKIGVVTLATAPASYVPSVWIQCYDYNSDYCESSRAYAYTWSGSFQNEWNVKVVNCYDDTDCDSGNTCDKSGSWDTWGCKPRACYPYDPNCDGCVSRDELMVYGSKWLSHDITREVLMVAGSVWLHRDKTKC